MLKLFLYLQTEIMTVKAPTIDITIPVLNEQETLERQVLRLREFLLNNFPEPGIWHIVIADNGSTDNTLTIAKDLQRRFSEIKTINVPARGVGLALKTSWGHSVADIVGYMDLDLATDLSHFPQVYDSIFKGGYDFVYGTRLNAKSRVIGRTLKREITSRAFNLILKSYLNVSFSDGMCGFKFLKRDIYAALKHGGAISDGWFFSTELLTVAEWQGFKILELPVQWTDDTSSSRVKILPLAIQYLKAMKALKSKKPRV